MNYRILQCKFTQTDIRHYNTVNDLLNAQSIALSKVINFITQT